MKTKIYVTVETLSGDNQSISLPSPVWVGNEMIRTGVALKAIYRGPRTGRMFIYTSSIWQKQNGRGIEGEKYTEINESQFLGFCALVGCTHAIAPVEV